MNKSEIRKNFIRNLENMPPHAVRHLLSVETQEELDILYKIAENKFLRHIIATVRRTKNGNLGNHQTGQRAHIQLSRGILLGLFPEFFY